MRRPARSLLVPLAVFGGVFALATLAGFVFRHEPAPDEVRVTIEDAPATDDGPSRLAGTVVDVDGSTLVLEADGERVEVTLPRGARIEELRRIDGAALPVGTRVNLGGEPTDFGPVVTGLVAIEAP